jgi:hypothetical protein
MGRHDSSSNSASSDSSECGVGCGVPNPRCNPKKCSNPFLNAPAYYDFDCSSIACCDPKCNTDCGEGLCDTDTLTTCPKVEHFYKKDMSESSSATSECKRNKRGKCENCGFKKCRCDESERSLPDLLCYDDSDSCSSDSECEPKCGWNVPYAPFPGALMKKPKWCEQTEVSDSSFCDSSSSKHNKSNHKSDNHKNHKPCPPNPSKNTCFTVTMGSKETHPWRNRIVGSNLCYMVNGKAGKTIHVDEGESYTFNVSTPLQPVGMSFFVGAMDQFYFTSDPQGGRKGQQCDSPNYDPMPLPGSPQPLSNGSMTLYVDASYPPIFYYQSKNHPCMGYMVIKHGKK